MFIATLIADGTLDESVMFELTHQLDANPKFRLRNADWIDYECAFDITFASSDLQTGQCAAFAEALRQEAMSVAKGGFGRDLELDVIVQPAPWRAKKLLVADMDSTMITVECIDELADYAGIKAEIAAVTEAAMRGELDFGAALDARVALLKGLEAGAIDRCLAERVTIMAGAKALVRTMRARGAETILVSGGFTRFAEPVAAEIGFDRAIANVLELADGALTGAVSKPIVDSSTKERTLVEARDRLGLAAHETLAIGDGANDLAMIKLAGLGVAYHAKPIVAAAAGARIDRGDLTALLYAQGVSRKDWVR